MRALRLALRQEIGLLSTSMCMGTIHPPTHYQFPSNRKDSLQQSRTILDEWACYTHLPGHITCTDGAEGKGHG